MGNEGDYQILLRIISSLGGDAGKVFGTPEGAQALQRAGLTVEQAKELYLNKGNPGGGFGDFLGNVGSSIAKLLNVQGMAARIPQIAAGAPSDVMRGTPTADPDILAQLAKNRPPAQDWGNAGINAGSGASLRNSSPAWGAAAAGAGLGATKVNMPAPSPSSALMRMINTGLGVVAGAKSRADGPPNLPSQGAMPGMPSFQALPPPPPQFNFKMNDFSDRANSMAAKAYAPLTAALDRRQTNIGSNYDMSSKVVQGLYKQLLSGIADNTSKINANYSDAQAANQSTGADTRQAIGNTYASSQGQLTDLVNKIGGGQAAGAAVLPNGLGEQAYQQSRSLNNQQSQGNALTQQGTAAKDYQAAQSQAQATQGAYNQQDLLRQRGNALSDLDMQRAQYASQQAQQGIQLGQDMTGRDMSLQQLNYGSGQDFYKNLVNGVAQGNQQVQQNYDNQMGQFSAGNNMNQQNYQNQMGRFDMNQQAKAGAAKAIQDQQQSQFDQQLALAKLQQQQNASNQQWDIARLNDSTNRARIQPKVTEPTDPGGMLDALISQVAPGNEQNTKSVLNSIIGSMDPHMAGNISANPDAFGQYVRQKATELNSKDPSLKVDLDQIVRIAQGYATSKLVPKPPRN